MDTARVFVVGGGGTGGALAHDLALRGLDVTLPVSYTHLTLPTILRV